MKMANLQFILSDKTTDVVVKMVMGHVLNMPKDKNFQPKLSAAKEFLDQALPPHPGAFAAYLKILELFPVVEKVVIPEGMQGFLRENWDEIEKYYEDESGDKIPDRYRPSQILVKKSNLVGLDGQAL